MVVFDCSRENYAKLKEEVEELKTNQDVFTTLQAMHSQLEWASTVENERQQRMDEMVQKD